MKRYIGKIKIDSIEINSDNKRTAKIEMIKLITDDLKNRGYLEIKEVKK